MIGHEVLGQYHSELVKTIEDEYNAIKRRIDSEKDLETLKRLAVEFECVSRIYNKMAEINSRSTKAVVAAYRAAVYGGK